MTSSSNADHAHHAGRRTKLPFLLNSLNFFTAGISDLTLGRSVVGTTVLRAERSRVLIPVGATDFLASRKPHTGSRNHPTSFSKGTGVFSQGCSRRDVMLTTQHHLAPRLKMDGALLVKFKGKGHPCTGTEALYRPYGP